MKTRVFIDDGYPESQEYNDNYHFLSEVDVDRQLRGWAVPGRARDGVRAASRQRSPRSEARARGRAESSLSVVALLKRTWEGCADRIRYSLHG